MIIKLSEHAGECVAFVGEKPVATALTSVIAYNMAKKLYPTQMITLFRVPRKREVVTFL